MNKRKTTKG